MLNCRWLLFLLAMTAPWLVSCSATTKAQRPCDVRCASASTDSGRQSAKAGAVKGKLADVPIEVELCEFVPKSGRECDDSTAKSETTCKIDDLFTGKRNPKVPDLKFPLETGILSSAFGYRRGVFHSGLDIAACEGEPIKACAKGQVLFTGSRKSYRSYGQTVMLEHGDNVYTYYAHMSKILARKGQKVAPGDVIGLVGSTGRSTSPHLHLEVRVGPQVYNPLVYFPSDQLKTVEIAKSFNQMPMGPVAGRKRLSGDR
jgi:hypothetical protein